MSDTADRSEAPAQPGPASLLAAAAALGTIDRAVRGAGTGTPEDGSERGDDPSAGPTRVEQALATLLLLREVRHQLAEWEPGLIEAAREAGASWADLARPLGVTSRQAAERRYLRLRPDVTGATGEERVKATRDRRAAERSVTAWARDNAADLRRLAGQITSLPGLPAAAATPIGRLSHALAQDDAAHLVGALADTHPHLRDGHPDLAARVDAVTRHTDRLREDSDVRRRQPD
ncbi:type III effector protein [Streptomyces huiliensis]|uniref:type III effector protein n=1 Tax=Streptomyces huiliensis TaxID=2876027 RepID=UPI001CBC52A9|nr:type III effector protein [Streptomyces huiliensis]MBZ4323796.1 type III effector protein [Streptomyces huiliensis]